ncbi:MAG TPA: sigma-70 family RNA polymerase sigma factor [Rhizomicrobium sp.]|nr:sigma-70 family RNA polymerase sigma factor [Rhizomicrobium sp.]
MSNREPLPAETRTLVARAGSGDRRATERLIVLYQQRIARFVVAQTNDASHYEDLCQTIFVKMVLALPKLRSPEVFEPWLFQIARNACRDHLRARLGWRRLFVSYDRDHDGVAVPEQGTAGDEEAVARAIERLPESQRSILQLSLDGQRSYEDMARLSHSSVSAVKSRLHRARENLRALMMAGDLE